MVGSRGDGGPTSVISEKNLILFTILAFRREAQSWATTRARVMETRSWESFRADMVARFASQKETAKVVTRFFTRKGAFPYKDYLDFLKDASFLLRKGSMNAEALIKQVVVRSPAEIKSLILVAAGRSCDWWVLKKAAEESA